MKTSWTQGLEKGEKAEMKAFFEQALYVRKRLSSIINNKISTSLGGDTLVSSYDNPNWALKQADSVGYRRALSELLSILE